MQADQIAIGVLTMMKGSVEILKEWISFAFVRLFFDLMF